MNSLTRYFEGLLVGGGIGFVIGMLTAPKSGAETRRELADKSEDLYLRANEQFSTIKDRANVALQDLQTRREEMMTNVQQIRGSVNEQLHQVAEKGREMKDKLNETATQVAEQGRAMTDRMRQGGQGGQGAQGGQEQGQDWSSNQQQYGT